ncbi:arylesterase [Alkanindiges sp. WGS2144]|uniref:arylesterase n=1 Tax=Alkanindiges sp. WGS2144 TaxID=3366808 RepID=UPI003751A987
MKFPGQNVLLSSLKSFTLWLVPGLSLLLVSTIASAKTVLILGDSISAGYGINVEQGWVTKLQQRLDQKYPKQHQVINASVSGETTSGALARLPKLLSTYKPHIVVIELGGNDALRGQPPASIQNNLNRLVTLSKNAKAKPILLGMKIPPNYGAAYSKAFEQTYRTVATNHKVTLLPFFLQGVAGNNKLMQQDLVHPTASAQARLLDNAWPFIEPALK